jgi:amino acid transporter
MAQMLDYISGPFAWVAVLAGGVLILGVRACFSELDGIYPTAAGIRLWMARAMNDRLALIITLTYMTAIVLVIAADAFIIGEAMAYAFGNGRVLAVVYVALLLVLATILNLRGIKLAGSLEKIVTSIVVLASIGIGITAIVKRGPTPPKLIGGGSPLQALILGIFLYTAFEWVTTNSEEVVKPKIIPRAMFIAIFVLAVSQSIFAVAMGLNLGVDGRASAYPQLLVAEQTMGNVGMLLMLAVTALTAVNTFNGGFVTLSRFMYAVAREGKLPRSLTTLNDRAVPVVPVILLGVSSLVLAVVVAITGAWTMIVSMCAALEMMIYATAAFVVFRLRKRQAEVDRPFKLLGGRPVAIAIMILFGFLAVVSSTTVGKETSATPLITLAVIAGIVALYVFLYVPRLEKREAEELAARRAARAAARNA